MPGDVDDVVGAAHHPHVAVLVDAAPVAGQVVAGILTEIRLHEPLVRARVGGHDRLSALDHFLHDRLRRSLRSAFLIVDVANNSRAQRAGDRIEQQNHSALGAQPANGEIENAIQNVIQVE